MSPCFYDSLNILLKVVETAGYAQRAYVLLFEYGGVVFAGKPISSLRARRLVFRSFFSLILVVRLVG